MSKKLPYSRADRVATEIHQVLAPYIHDCLSDPRVAGVQITHVKVARDLRLARIYYFLRGTAAQRQDCHDGLEHAAGKMKQQMGDQMSLRYMPALEFHFDEAIEQGERIDDLLKVIHDHDEQGRRSDSGAVARGSDNRDASRRALRTTGKNPS